MPATADKAEKRKLFNAIFAFAAIPYWLVTVGNCFSKAYLAAFHGASVDQTVYEGMYHLTGFVVPVIVALAYLWARPALQYKENPSPELKTRLRRRIGNLYIDSAALLAGMGGLQLLLGMRAAGAVPAGTVPALLLGLFVQLAVLPIAVDWTKTRSSLLVETLYSQEELYGLRPEFSIPLYLKLGLLILSCALLPFGFILAASRYGAPFSAWPGEFLTLLVMSAITLAVGVGVVFYGIQRPLDGLIGRMRRVAGGDYAKTRIYFSDEVARLKAGFNEMVDGLKERDELQDTFGKYMSIEIARELIHKKKVNLGGEAMEAAVMFCDIRNFTPLSEKMDAAEVVAFLNEYFRYITTAIDLNHGVINKFLGDAVMAVYTPMLGSADYAADAVRAAAGMRRSLAEFNASGRFPFKVDFGIGIHAGRLVAGNIGTFSRLEYTFIGDTVNVAARLQSKTKDFNTDVVISAAAVGKAKGSLGGDVRFESLGRTALKGKSDMLEVYKLL